jgi:hypothetical protein
MVQDQRQAPLGQRVVKKNGSFFGSDLFFSYICTPEQTKPARQALEKMPKWRNW